MQSGIIVLRRLEHADEIRAFVDGKILWLLAVKDLGGNLDPVSAATEVHGVRIKLDDLVLRVRTLDLNSSQLLSDLATHRNLGREIEVASQLLRDRRRTF